MAEIRGIGKFDIQVEGLDKLQSQFDKVGKFPKKYLTKSAKEGSKNPLRDIKATAPVGETGLLKKGIQRFMESRHKKTKTVYRIRWNPKFSAEYKKPTTGVYGGETPEAYYPHSIEYGYLGKHGRIETKFYHFVHDAIEKNQKDSLQKVVNSLNESLDTLLK